MRSKDNPLVLDIDDIVPGAYHDPYMGDFFRLFNSPLGLGLTDEMINNVVDEYIEAFYGS